MPVFLLDFVAIPTVWYFPSWISQLYRNPIENNTLSVQLPNPIEKYHTVGIVRNQKNTTLSVQLRISQLYRPIGVVQLFYWISQSILRECGIASIGFRSYSRQCGIFLLDFVPHCRYTESVVLFYWISNSSYTDSVVFLPLDFVAIPTVWYFSIVFRNYTDSVVFFYWISVAIQQKNNTVCYEIFSIGFRSYTDSTTLVFFYWISQLFRQCGIFLLDFVAIPTVWYFTIEFRSYSVSYVIFLLDFVAIPTVWYFPSWISVAIPNSVVLRNQKNTTLSIATISQLYRQCGIFTKLDFVAIPTVWYEIQQENTIGFRSYSYDSVVF